MNRRTFVNTSILSVCSVPFFNLKAYSTNVSAKPEWIIEWIKINEQQLPGFKSLKVISATNKYFGGYTDHVEIPNPHTTSSFISKACMLMFCPESAYYQSKDLLKEVEAAANAMLKFQHTDGTIDLLATNFHSTPDTAFILENIIPAYKFAT